MVSNGAVKGRAGALRQPNRASDAQCAVIREALAAHRRTRRCRHFGGRPESDRLLGPLDGDAAVARQRALQMEAHQAVVARLPQ